MKKKKKISKTTAPEPAQKITMMEVQEKLGLFAETQPEELLPQDTQEILKKRPLGYI
jgi:hypothetical protein